MLVSLQFSQQRTTSCFVISFFALKYDHWNQKVFFYTGFHECSHDVVLLNVSEGLWERSVRSTHLSYPKPLTLVFHSMWGTKNSPAFLIKAKLGGVAHRERQIGLEDSIPLFIHWENPPQEKLQEDNLWVPSSCTVPGESDEEREQLLQAQGLWLTNHCDSLGKKLRGLRKSPQN